MAVLVCWAATVAFAWVSPNVARTRADQSFAEASNCVSHRDVRRSSVQVRLGAQSQPSQWNNSNVRSLPYDSALQALQGYHESNGDLAIPRGFIVPATDGEIAKSCRFSSNFLPRSFWCVFALACVLKTTISCRKQSIPLSGTESNLLITSTTWTGGQSTSQKIQAVCPN